MNDCENLAAELVTSASASFRANKSGADNAIAQVSDEQLHVALDENTNSVAVITKHVGGNSAATPVPIDSHFASG